MAVRVCIEVENWKELINKAAGADVSGVLDKLPPSVLSGEALVAVKLADEVRPALEAKGVRATITIESRPGEEVSIIGPIPAFVAGGALGALLAALLGGE